jgi:hypothetical protein
VIIAAIGLIILIKKFGKVPIGHVGPDMNLLTYGFLWDTIFAALQGEHYFSRIEPAFNGERGLILAAIAIGNLILLAWNFQVVQEIESARKINQRAKLGGKRFLSLFLGLMSLFAFLVIKVKFN